jgi:hypothetical protein
MVAIEIQISSAPGSAHADSQRSSLEGWLIGSSIQFEAGGVPSIASAADCDGRSALVDYRLNPISR